MSVDFSNKRLNAKFVESLLKLLMRQSKLTEISLSIVCLDAGTFSINFGKILCCGSKAEISSALDPQYLFLFTLHQCKGVMPQRY